MTMANEHHDLICGDSEEPVSAPEPPNYVPPDPTGEINPSWNPLQQITETSASSEVARATCIICGLPLTKNPHPDAGKMNLLNVVGSVYGCMPCAEARANGRYKMFANFNRWIEGEMSDANAAGKTREWNLLNDVLAKFRSLEETRRKDFHALSQGKNR